MTQKNEKGSEAIVPVQPKKGVSKNKLGVRERQKIEEIFMEDFEAINKALRKQLQGFYGVVRQQLLDELGLNEATEEAKRLEEEIKQKQLELQRLREKITREIYLAEQRLAVVKEESIGQYNEAPEPEQLLELGFNHDTPIKDREWYGFPVRTKLEAMTCLKLKSLADVATPLTAVRKIAQSVQREMAFVSTYEDAQAVYEKFYSLNFRQYGVDIPPRLDDLKKLRGEKLLQMSVVEESRLLPAAGETTGAK